MVLVSMTCMTEVKKERGAYKSKPKAFRVKPNEEELIRFLQQYDYVRTPTKESILAAGGAIATVQRYKLVSVVLIKGRSQKVVQQELKLPKNLLQQCINKVKDGQMLHSKRGRQTQSQPPLNQQLTQSMQLADTRTAHNGIFQRRCTNIR